MAYCFGDGFDCYASVNDPIAGFWDGGTTTGVTLAAGRFAGSQCISITYAAQSIVLSKSSGANDAIHHIVCGFRQTAGLAGSTVGTYLQLSDGATNQVCVCFRSDGAILLTSATPTGTTLATWTLGPPPVSAHRPVCESNAHDSVPYPGTLTRAADGRDSPAVASVLRSVAALRK